MTANLADLLRRAAAEAPDSVALVDAGTGRRTTWAELDEAASRVARGFEQQGLVAGNRVVIATANRPELVVVYLATLRAHLVAVPVNPRSATGELLRMVTDAGARLLVADATTIDSARAVAAGLEEALAGADDELRARSVVPRIVALDCRAGSREIEFATLLAADRVPLPPTRDAESLAVLLYTSGTSSRPRAAMLSHRALVANIEQGAAVEPPMVGPDDVVYGVLPMFHVYGLNAVLGQVLRQHATLVVVEGFDPAGSLEEIEHHAVTVVPVAPAVLAHWRDRDDLAERLGGVRTIMSGSAPLSPEVLADFAERSGVPVHQGYGLTEAAPVVTSTLCSRAAKPGSVGAALPGVSLRLVDETGQRPEGSDPGEIHVAGDNLFSGYWPDGADGPVDGWFATGDVGFLDPDGDLFLVDRLKELIIVSGFNVYPSEIEEVLEEVDGVEEAAVVGVPDEATGEAVVAYVRTAAREGDDADDLRDRVRSACHLRLARFKQPSRVELVEALPHTITGKVAKGRLRATVRRTQLGLLE
ncbi:MAG TPA: AMP-binding protein [Marmoricola sp.]|nr:AMP-binding protein [Marmoricola sp.]